MAMERVAYNEVGSHVPNSPSQRYMHAIDASHRPPYTSLRASRLHRLRRCLEPLRSRRLPVPRLVLPLLLPKKHFSYFLLWYRRDQSSCRAFPYL
uniref:Uncharacterized protein n=1 Tax=Rhizophora mucronata TaxID=61149 RepID=A0A2P2NFK2_RHIMU